MIASRALLIIIVCTSACMVQPTNGTTASGGVVGRTFEFQGFYNMC